MTSARPMRLLAITALSDLPEAHLIAGLARAGVEVDLVSDERAIYHQIWDAVGIPSQKLRFHDKFDPVVIRELRRKLRTGRYDLFHAFSNRPLTNAMIASAGIRILRIGYCGTTGHLRPWDPAARLTFYSRRLHRIMCLSDAVRGYLRDAGIADERLCTIYKGHDPAWYRARDRSALQAFGIPADAFVAVCLANIRPVKGVDVLTRAVARLPADSKVHLLLLGEERYPRVRQIARQLAIEDRVHFAGFRDDAAGLAGACDLCVMPSVRNEGLGKAVMECMCMGVPALVSAVGGLPELVTAGETGMLVPPGDDAALARALRYAETHPDELRRMGTACVRRIVEKFHISEAVRRVMAMYAQIGAPTGSRTPLTRMKT